MITTRVELKGFFQIASLLALSSIATGCSVVKEYHDLVQGFWQKVDHLARADQLNGQLQARLAALEKENLKLRYAMAQGQESHRAHDLKAEALHEGGFEGARTEKSLVPELYAHGEGHVSDQHHAQGQERHHASDATAHGGDAHRAPAGHGEPRDHSEARISSESGHGGAGQAPTAQNQHADAHHGGKSPNQAEPEAEEETTGPDLGIMSIPPKKIFAEAMKAFERREFDRAARGFIALANHKENRIHATAHVNYLAGVSLFELHNYRKALQYFKTSHGLAGSDRKPAASARGTGLGNDIAFAPRALGWIALCHRKLGQASEAQQTVQDLINRYPHSPEAKRFR